MQQQCLFDLDSPGIHFAATTGDTNKLMHSDRAAHDWYRFVLSFPPHLVRHYLEQFEIETGQCVLDPFCGTGTTLVECKKLGIESVGVEANQMAYFASKVKTDWSPDSGALRRHAEKIADACHRVLSSQQLADVPDQINLNGQPLRTLPPEQARLLIKDSISPLPLHKTLVLLSRLACQADQRHERHERLALAKALVSSISNLKFGPEVGVGRKKRDAVVIAAWLSQLDCIASDLESLRELDPAAVLTHHADSRQIGSLLRPNSVDAVITSPPYPNEKDYSRTTRLESVLLGFMRDRRELRSMKQTFIRSNTRGVYVKDSDDEWIEAFASIKRIADEIERRRIEMGKTSGFERLYARVTKLYFGGMVRHLSEMKSVLRPGARLAYVVGDQASYLRVMIRTGEILAEIAEGLGYKVEGIDLFRTRFATATGEQLREEVVVLRWPS